MPADFEFPQASPSMSVRGTDNLRCYLREAVLPEMICHPKAPIIPPHGHKSHLNHLKVRPERWRRLECIQPIDSGIMDKRVTDWIDTYIPDTSLGCEDTDSRTGESLTIPCSPVFDIPPHAEMRPTDIFRMVPWLDNLPLITAQRILHLIYPRSSAWNFSLSDVANKDYNIFQYFAWTLQAESRYAFEEANEETKRDIGRHSIVLAFQPPWILSYQDLKEFADCRSFPPYLLSGNAFPTPLESKDRLWAKLWDTCAERRTPWFIITSYHYWVFGAFSRGWTTAFVSRVYEYDYYSPTIVECLTYWAASALHIRGTWKIPEVAEPFEDIIRPLHIPEPSDDEITEPAPSESNWAGKNSEMASSAGVTMSLSDIVSDDLLGVSIPPYRRIGPYYNMKNWMRTVIDDDMLVGIAEEGEEQELRPEPISKYDETGPNNQGVWLV